ncbi:hypothetical protein SAMN03080617_00658 [Algoriphagus alkaliphilus]|uniref:Uncharacterized protein n=1 Tax=Algoriphagus alkaliphilus TaxID=279824 RepID=A0A1G5VRL0_9BACT|nr:hypothetical protein [Algoriphagus alkaliphilus]MBA4298541.1 hypothetical protein [Cyclobacterium sp.]SDA48482.1 hypothetical protein SAMN03080617_00658 [Algoriphagus alkaliphilus]
MNPQPEKNKLSSSALVQETFRHWLSDHDQVRCPFPMEIHQVLRKKTFDKFYEWIDTLDQKGKEEMGDDFFREKLEELLFETGLELVESEDEKLSIYFPFLMRVGDQVQSGDNGAGEISKVISRRIEKEGDIKFFTVILENQKTKRSWESKFELPA